LFSQTSAAISSHFFING